MSTSQSSHVLSAPMSSGSASVPVYNLAVLVQSIAAGPTVARAANLSLEVVEAESVREALSQVVESAKALIAEHVAHGRQIPWVDPPREPTESESRFMVPLHL